MNKKKKYEIYINIQKKIKINMKESIIINFSYKLEIN